MPTALSGRTQQEVADEIEEMFEAFDDWTDKYEVLIDLGKRLPPMDPALKTEASRVKGCQSNVWVSAHAEDRPGGTVVVFSADSDAAITKGLVSILWHLFSGQGPEQILGFDTEQYMDRLGLSAHLSMQRRNGLAGMINQVKSLAKSGPIECH